MKKTVVLLAGGFSEEREISLISSEAIFKSLISLGYNVEKVDVADFSSWLEFGSYLVRIKPHIVFNGLHGGIGENGKIQAFLSLLKIPFTGSGYEASVLAMDKIVSFQIAASLNVLTAPYFIVDNRNCQDFDIKKTGYPLVVKPNDSGSSCGITIIADEGGLNDAVQKAFQYSSRVICQQYVAGSELTVSILGNKALPVVEIRPKKGWYDFTNKYTQGNTEYIVPAEISSALTNNLQRDAKNLFKELGCKAYARIDFRYDGKDYYLLELNTLPGMTSLSLTPMAAQYAGISFDNLIDKIIEYSLD